MWDALRGRGTWNDLAQRILGPRIEGPTIWMHLSSVGEANSIKAAVEHLSKSHRVLVTTGTTTGRDTIASWKLANVYSGLAPLDLGWITRIFLRQNQVLALIIVENELWPARILTTQGTGLPVIMLNARMSAATMRTWTRFPKTARRLLAGMTAILPQDRASADRLCDLGAPPSRMADPFNLKAIYRPKSEPLSKTAAQFDRSTTLLAAATHTGEEELILDAFSLAKAKEADLKFIIAPRHPKRGLEILAMAEASGLSAAVHSEEIFQDQDILIADSLGEMHHWYRAASAAFIGGSLVPSGGHTPFEPAAYRCPVIHGPHIENFEEAYAKLHRTQGAWEVTSAAELCNAFLEARLTRPTVSPFQANGDVVLASLDAALSGSSKA